MILEKSHLTLYRGAFNFGANSVARYRASNLSMLGLSHTTPVVIVQIQYRLGVLGFAASSDISSSSPSAILGNYGLVDQINALQWVQAHISSFGGDPTNVTAFGVSAGSASVHYHILTGNPLFDRAICMSGSAPVLGPLDFKLFEEAWTNSCVKLGIADLSPAERLQHLRAMKPLEVLEVYSGSPFGPVADGKLLPSQWTLGDVHPVTRCKQLILGDTRVEAIIMDGLIQSIAQDKWQDMVSSHFSSPTVAEGFKTAFGFPAFAVPELPYEEYRDLMRRFLSVGMFQHGALGVAETFAPAGKAYLYHFEEPSPYPGPTLGLPYHGQCALFVYQNHVPEYPTEAAATAREMGKIWTAFAHGKEPWNEYKVGGEFMRLGPEGKCEMVSMQEDNCRDYSYLPWLRENFEEVRGFVQKVTIRP
jgi:carboxylesterase type B